VVHSHLIARHIVILTNIYRHNPSVKEINIHTVATRRPNVGSSLLPSKSMVKKSVGLGNPLT
jgi:hypothetical protein